MNFKLPNWRKNQIKSILNSYKKCKNFMISKLPNYPKPDQILRLVYL